MLWHPTPEKHISCPFPSFTLSYSLFPITPPVHTMSILIFSLFPSNSDQSFPPLPFLILSYPPPMSNSLVLLTVLQACCGHLHSTAQTHTHISYPQAHLVTDSESPPLLHDGLGLVLTVTVCDCDLRLTCWGYMASLGYLHNAQGERWGKPSENKRGGWGWGEDRRGRGKKKAG